MTAIYRVYVKYFKELEFPDGDYIMFLYLDMAKSTVCYTVWWKNMKNFANSAYCLLPTVILVT